jgi:hypothetical protein
MDVTVRANVLACLLLAPAIALAEPLPAGWTKAGNQPAEYDVGTDTGTRHGGRASGFVKFVATEPHGFGTLMQTSGPGAYLGKRVRLSAFVKTEKVDRGWAGLWLRLDGPQAGQSPRVLGFDNMQDRGIKATNDWKRVEIVLDVPAETVNLAFGVLLAGDGEVWIDDLAFEIVPQTVPVTSHGLTSAPSNLDFER